MTWWTAPANSIRGGLDTLLCNHAKVISQRLTPITLRLWEQLIRCFKINLRVEAMVAEDDTVAVRYIERGTFSSPYRGISPTGKSYEVIAMEWFVLRDGKITQRWGARDSAAIFGQMGVPLS